MASRVAYECQDNAASFSGKAGNFFYKELWEKSREERSFVTIPGPCIRGSETPHTPMHAPGKSSQCGGQAGPPGVRGVNIAAYSPARMKSHLGRDSTTWGGEIAIWKFYTRATDTGGSRKATEVHFPHQGGAT